MFLIVWSRLVFYCSAFWIFISISSMSFLSCPNRFQTFSCSHSSAVSSLGCQPTFSGQWRVHLPFDFYSPKHEPDPFGIQTDLPARPQFLTSFPFFPVPSVGSHRRADPEPRPHRRRPCRQLLPPPPGQQSQPPCPPDR